MKRTVTRVRQKLLRHKGLNIGEKFSTKWFFPELSVRKCVHIYASLWKTMAPKKKDLARKYNISRASLYRILKEENMGLKGNVRGEDIQRRGRPRKLNERDERLLLRQIDVLRRQEGSFSVKRLMVQAGIDARTVSSKTVRRLLHRHGYKYIEARRKGILTEADHKGRLKFARGIKRDYTSTLWTEQVAFYLDGVSFVYKYNPADQARST